MLNVDEAQEIILAHTKLSRHVQKGILEASGFALAEEIHADRDYPPFNRATMDGYAILSSDLNDHHIKEFNVTREVFAGMPAGESLVSGNAVKIMTGAMVPDGADAIIQVEQSIQTGPHVIFDVTEIQAGKNIAQRGEDAKKNDLILSKGHVIQPYVISMLATLGINKVQVYDSPTVAILSTGDEIVPIDQPPLTHQIRDSNHYNLKSSLQNYWIVPSYYDIVRDTKAELEKAIERGLKEDILIISGGVSMGDADFVPDVLASFGVKKLFHKVKIKPGKPLWFGETETGVVFGVPGNPVSCQVVYKIFIEPYIRKVMGLGDMRRLKLPLAEGHRIKGERTV
ncbi:MAG TPA: molybdopterin molybdenumtransferase MoeA, partial [Spirochaetes bacterium]|nr:molybdopterin molybdenumtransferase MoeA [Spirochaetota bacterium]